MILKKKNTWLPKVLKTLKSIENENLIIACSGGADSMVLLDIIVHAGFNTHSITVCHVNHNLRTSADRDEKIVEKYCKKNNIKFSILSPDVKKVAKETRTTIEECARNIRKDFFESIRKKHKAKYIITAHHADDQSETLIYRITKWTAITGLVGIEEHAGEYFRPLLSVTKRELLEYAQNHKIVFGFDETNDDTNIPRNLIRKTVVPELQKINPEMVSALARLSNSARDLKMSFDAFFTEVIDKKSFTLDWYNGLPLWFQHELLRFLYEHINKSTHGLSTALITELDRFLSTRNGWKKEIKKMKLEKKKGIVFISEM